MGAQVGDGTAWIVSEIEEAAGQRTASRNCRTQNGEVDGKREQIVRFGGEIGDPVADCDVHDGLPAERMGNRLAISFEQKHLFLTF